MINRQALFTDETLNFKTPYEPKVGDEVSLLFRTLKNDVSGIYLILNGARIAMEKSATDDSETFDFFHVTFTCPCEEVNYYFEILDVNEVLYYNRLGASPNNQSEYNFSFVPDFTVPEWALGRVFYQIYVDRFCNGNPKNDVVNNEYYYTGGHSKKIDDWNKIPDVLDVNNFYGGDLQGVMDMLDYLQDLGVEGVYFNPIFVSPSNHKYDTQDYDYIDPHFAVIEDDCHQAMEGWEHNNGFAVRYIKRITSKVNLEKSNEYFASLVDVMHERGMKVVIDGVFNHCGSFNKWMDREGIYLNKAGYEKGAYQSVESPYRAYFNFNQPIARSDYEGWWGFQTLPKLNYEGSVELCSYILKTGAKWVSAPYNVDGWRLDVGADLGHSEEFNHNFWRAFRKSVKDANSQAFIFAEHYGDPSAWFDGYQWDSVMNYDAFMEPVTWFLTGVDKHSKSADPSRYNDGQMFFDSMFKGMAKFPRPSLDCAINQLSNHDHSRFLTRTSRIVGTIDSMGGAAASYGIDKRVMALGVLIQMTWPGSPAIYYADEVGQVGWTDPDCRRTYPFGNEDWELHGIHKKIIALRKKLHCLKLGSLVKLDAGNGYISYGRFDKVDSAVITINNSDKEVSLAVPVWQMGITWTDNVELAYFVGEDAYTPPHMLEVKYGVAHITLPPKCGVVYYRKKGYSIKPLRLYSGKLHFTQSEKK
jgi:alpha-glucosidase